MATHDTQIHRGHAAVDVLAPVRGVIWFLDAVVRAQRTASAYEHLASLSDEALTAKGLTRADLAATAYRRHFEG